ncbi:MULTISPECIES: hypothetical protein [Thalassobaculum]|uniref:Uncharacterized protein n=1 Tax=Thalassobaculum litoreum DSM 18839 TaxID=1123362 RepID=A0A8G2BFQ7_9PROT|nr:MULTISPECIES: hypothetical protein [Thalassobaculum]SDF12032.1 hypothetical protein SAMN05660686_00337 [Thalassobaculum litoreum DSM 18839]
MWVNDGQDPIYAAFWRSLVLFLAVVLVLMLAQIAPVFLEGRFGGNSAVGYLIVYLLGFPIVAIAVSALSAAVFYGIPAVRRLTGRLPYPVLMLQPLHMVSGAVFFLVFVRP